MQNTIADPWTALESFKDGQFERLYRNPHSALAIFRKRISELGQSIVTTMLYVPRPIAKSDLEMFVSPGSARAFNQALSALQQYHIAKEIQLGGVESFFLTHEFARSLKKALDDAKGGNSCSEAMKLPAAAPVEIEKLDTFAAKQAEDMLRFVIATAASTAPEREDPSTPSTSIKELLASGEIISISGTQKDSSRARLYKHGLSFITQRLDAQLWSLIFLYIRKMSSRTFDEVDALSFILLVASLETGSTYSTINLDKEQLRILEFLSALGVVLLNRRTGSACITNYIPTSLAASLISEADFEVVEEESPLYKLLTTGIHPPDGFIIVDTAFHVTAHPSLPIQTTLLSLFANMDSSQGNVLSGSISQVSVQRAFEHDISAQQIVSYINNHAHPKMHAIARQQRLARGPCGNALPSTVADQIHAWESDWNRAKAAAESLAKDFESCLNCNVRCRCADEVKEVGLITPTDSSHKQTAVSLIRGV